MLNREVSIRKPKWLKSGIPVGDNYKEIKKQLRAEGLFTVCEEAKCPNLSECWEQRTATLMILGDTCTRACKFCHVKTGNPKGFLNHDEIENSVKLVSMMNLRYVVITSVDRDDLPDFGASHFGNVVTAINQKFPEAKVEVLIPDFNAEEEAMHTMAKSNPFVIAQNIETVKRLTHPVRDRRAGYEKTLKALKFYRDHYPHIPTKTSIMVGLGETMDEIRETLVDLKEVGVRIFTAGQYLQPSRNHLGVERFYTLEDFEKIKEMAYEIGFEFVASGPMVRSSYKAAEFLDYLEGLKRS
ncbi:MAG: lipoyl synthase [Bacteriovoracaceae bacterium]